MNALPSGKFALIHTDPQFNTGKQQRQIRTRMKRSKQGDRRGYQGRRYATKVLGVSASPDIFDDYLELQLRCAQQASLASHAR